MFLAFSIFFILIQIGISIWYFSAYLEVAKLKKDEIKYLKEVKRQFIRRKTIMNI
jgi:hypothetical protein